MASAPDRGPVPHVTRRARRRRVVEGRQSCAQVTGIAAERGGTILLRGAHGVISDGE